MSSSPPDPRAAASLPADLQEALDRNRGRLGQLASSVHYFPVIGSTNDMAGVLAEDGAHDGAVVLADEQHAGRGRRGHAWFSPAGSGLYVSVVMTPGRSREHGARATGLLTLAAGAALAEAIETVTGLRVDLKWPNDVYVAQRKLAGILAEASSAGAHGRPVVLGYGINVRAEAFPPELRDRASSLESELGRSVDRARVFVESLASLARRYEDLLAGRFDAILDAWRTRAPASIGTRISWSVGGEARSGVTTGIDDEGALLVRVGDHVERIVAGEIRWAAYPATSGIE